MRNGGKGGRLKVSLRKFFWRMEEGPDVIRDVRREKSRCLILLGGRVDDLISDVEYVERINSVLMKIPIVVTGKLDGTKVYQVQLDAMKAMELFLEYLISLEHRHIAFVGGDLNVTSTFEKMQSYKQVLLKHKMVYQEELMELGGYNSDKGYENMNKLLDKGVIPTAVIAINDFTAAGVIRSIVEHGYHIPDDISVVSYDNTYITELVMPKLTSIDYNYREFGKKLVHTAILAIEGENVIQKQLITPTLTIRESSCIA